LVLLIEVLLLRRLMLGVRLMLLRILTRGR
jgi:hypothetical protein